MATEANLEESKMPLLDHLIELRRRLVYSIAGFILAFFACFYVADELFNFLVAPLANLWEGEENRRLIFTALHEKFFTNIKVAFFAAAFISFPLVAAQFWTFVAPGLYKDEKRAMIPFLVATPILFLAGGALVYYMVMPVAWRFFASFQSLGGGDELAIELLPKVGEYLSLVMRLIFAFGISFELPVVITLLARVGMTSSEGLKRKRRYAIVLAFVAAAILTPPDPLSQISLALPIIGLYEISIWSARLVERKREEEDATDDDDDDDDDDGDDDDEDEDPEDDED
ncbi:MAG: twin-arginine translocase subunit TatC [Alphaproteobacteria bacterium]|jgi:sec-independent protein translocase protein TatC|nr:twin-arginine translocase subunit TatC [Rhodospirillaceae bacterium]MDP6406371.1 twin-arginine translocase subunit TatC [Alphaproteobacteria bacterium]MDP6624357.1 twin-arginine translocase subunit TatC [Alphaproteobacteria bacterium]|tara:strand:+ start:2651 stop:3505 length:855 start_codon:yes stop_codon:yes gene_type:complete